MMLSSDHVLQEEENKGEKKDKQDFIGYVQPSTVTVVITSVTAEWEEKDLRYKEQNMHSNQTR